MSTFPPSSVQRQHARRQPGDHVHQRGDAAGAASGRHRRGHRDDLAQFGRQHPIVLQFDINRDIDGAARDVQAAINAARADLPAALRSNPDLPQVQSGRRADPDPGADLQDADAGPDLRPASNILQQKLSQVHGVGEVHDRRRLAAGRARRAQSARPVQIRHRAGRRARRALRRQCQQPQGRDRAGRQRYPGLCQRHCDARPIEYRT